MCVMPICQSDSWLCTFHPVNTETLLQELFKHLTMTESTSKSVPAGLGKEEEEDNRWHSLTPFCIPYQIKPGMNRERCSMFVQG